jgi:hypothetical protein
VCIRMISSVRIDCSIVDDDIVGQSIRMPCWGGVEAPGGGGGGTRVRGTTSVMGDDSFTTTGCSPVVSVSFPVCFGIVFIWPTKKGLLVLVMTLGDKSEGDRPKFVRLCLVTLLCQGGRSFVMVDTCGPPFVCVEDDPFLGRCVCVCVVGGMVWE